MTRRVGNYGKRYNRAARGAPLTPRTEPTTPSLPDPDKNPPKCSSAQKKKGCYDADLGCWCPKSASPPTRRGRRFSGPDAVLAYFESRFKYAYTNKGFLGAIRIACKATYLNRRAKVSESHARKQTRHACMSLLKKLGYAKKSASSICGHCFFPRRR